MSGVSKLTRKFVISLSMIFILVAAVFLLINQKFVQRYFLYQEKKEMNRICDRLSGSGGPLAERIQEIEDSENVVIAWVESSEDNTLINERLRTAFLNKGIGLDQYWLWKQDQQDAMKNGRKMRIYAQPKLNYSLLVVYMPVDHYFVAAAKIIPSIGRTLSLINQVTVVVFSGALIVMFLLISVLVHRIIVPLTAIGKTARSIAALDFKTVEIHTGDELDILADDINHMSRRLEENHRELEQKNRQMKELLANVSHDLKTPVALIKAYSSGMKDGMDDGTFLDTIIVQNGRMELMIERLLNLAKLEKQEHTAEPVDISQCLTGLIEDYRVQADRGQRTFESEIEENVVIMANREAVEMIISNLLSNGVKYTADGRIEILLCREGEGIVFQTRNLAGDGETIDLQRLWEPFFVGEQSRNKEMSGTGLGLTIVKTACEQWGYGCECEFEDNWITFTIVFR